MDIHPPFEVESLIRTRLSFDYDRPPSRIDGLYEQAKRAQWNAATDIDWSIPVAFGEELPDDSSVATMVFRESPLASRGRRAWTRFLWEFQAWMISQFLHGEQGALVATARLAEELPTLDGKRFAATQVADEARHVEVFSRYLSEHVPEPFPISRSLAALLDQTLRTSSWDIVALGMQIVIEPIALATFRLANSSFHDELAQQIVARVARDEARHMSFGVLLLPSTLSALTARERCDREDFVLEAAMLMRRRFLLDDVWARLDVDRVQGEDFTASNEVMIAYRQAMFSKVVSALQRIGLMTDRVRRGLEQMDLLTRAARLALDQKGSGIDRSG
jgi:hypothetical protein